MSLVLRLLECLQDCLQDCRCWQCSCILGNEVPCTVHATCSKELAVMQNADKAAQVLNECNALLGIPLQPIANSQQDHLASVSKPSNTMSAVTTPTAVLKRKRHVSSDGQICSQQLHMQLSDDKSQDHSQTSSAALTSSSASVQKVQRRGHSQKSLDAELSHLPYCGRKWKKHRHHLQSQLTDRRLSQPTAACGPRAHHHHGRTEGMPTNASAKRACTSLVQADCPAASNAQYGADSSCCAASHAKAAFSSDSSSHLLVSSCQLELKRPQLSVHCNVK